MNAAGKDSRLPPTQCLFQGEKLYKNAHTLQLKISSFKFNCFNWNWSIILKTSNDFSFRFFVQMLPGRISDRVLNFRSDQRALKTASVVLQHTEE